jgi:hypothetical protein
MESITSTLYSTEADIFLRNEILTPSSLTILNTIYNSYIQINQNFDNLSGNFGNIQSSSTGTPLTTVGTTVGSGVFLVEPYRDIIQREHSL